jgi:hypothetical protein
VKVNVLLHSMLDRQLRELAGMPREITAHVFLCAVVGPP